MVKGYGLGLGFWDFEDIYLVFVKILGYVDIILLYELYFDVLGDYIWVVLY